ncbi:MAG TPA: hypothetical protein VLS89_07190 [Candidatus Nanopelagicales bacterium]|nr:hypothetical protein [Candidatus Nanopelagicales bacterium]
MSAALMVMAVAAVVSPASAQEELPPKLEAPKPTFLGDIEDERQEGLDYSIYSALQISVSDNLNVLGQTDGLNFLFGFKLDTSVAWNQGPWEWRTAAGVAGGVARTPLIAELVKARDFTSLDSTLLFHATPYFGPFARFALNTTLFIGADVRPAETSYVIARADGTTDAVLRRRLRTTDPLKPLTLKESLGPFLQPLTTDPLSVEARAGVGARQSFADGQLALADDPATAAVEIREMTDAHQIGVEAAVELWGALSQKRITYKITADVLVPFAYTALPPGDARGALELMNVSLLGSVSFQLVEWAKLDYELRMVREPLLIDRLQMQNNLLIGFGFLHPEPVDELCPCAK